MAQAKAKPVTEFLVKNSAGHCIFSGSKAGARVALDTAIRNAQANGSDASFQAFSRTVDGADVVESEVDL